MHANMYLEDPEGEISIRVGNSFVGQEVVHVSATIWKRIGRIDHGTFVHDIPLDYLVELINRNELKDYIESKAEEASMTLPNCQVASNMVKQCLKALMGGKFIPEYPLNEVGWDLGENYGN